MTRIFDKNANVRRMARFAGKALAWAIVMLALALLYDFIGGIWGTSNLSRYRAERLATAANGLEREGRFEEALAKFNAAIEIDPTNDNAHYGRGDVYFELKDYKQARIDWLAAASLAKTKVMLAQSLLGVGIVDSEEGRNEEALKHLDDALQVDSSLTNAYAARAKVYVFQEKHEKALTDLNRAISLDSKLEYLYVDRALVQQQLGNLAQAISDAEQAFALDPQSPRANVAVALVHFERGQWREAIPKLSLAIRSMPAQASFYELRARAHHELGAHASAERDLQHAESLQKSH